MIVAGGDFVGGHSYVYGDVWRYYVHDFSYVYCKCVMLEENFEISNPNYCIVRRGNCRSSDQPTQDIIPFYKLNIRQSTTRYYIPI